MYPKQRKGKNHTRNSGTITMKPEVKLRNQI